MLVYRTALRNDQVSYHSSEDAQGTHLLLGPAICVRCWSWSLEDGQGEGHHQTSTLQHHLRAATHA